MNQAYAIFLPDSGLNSQMVLYSYVINKLSDSLINTKEWVNVRFTLFHRQDDEEDSHREPIWRDAFAIA